MAMSISSLTSSFSSLSFSSQVSQKPYSISLAPSSKSLRLSQFSTNKPQSLTVLATVAAEPLTGDLETTNIEKYVKSRLPGGFAAQTLIGTGRRKCAIARVVIQEGTGKFIINYRDAQVAPYYPLIILPASYLHLFKNPFCFDIILFLALKLEFFSWSNLATKKSYQTHNWYRNYIKTYCCQIVNQRIFFCLRWWNLQHSS